MTLNLPNLYQMHALVWNLRAEISHTWTTPDKRTATRFLITECAELCDAYLRMVGGYARNNHKDLALPAELADVWLMALTAMGPEYHEINLQMTALDDQRLYILGLDDELDLGNAIDVLCEDVARLPRRFDYGTLKYVFYDCIILGEILKVDACTILEQKLQQIRSKYVTD
jgi:hypothetical protein